MKYFTLGIAALFMLFSCGGQKKEAEKARLAQQDSLSRPENVKTIAAIAKVEPLDGLVDISSSKSGIVTAVYKNAGDSVKKGDLLVKIDDQEQVLAVGVAEKQVLAQQSRAAADQADVLQYLASLKEKEQDLVVTERLAATGADTRQNVAIKRKEKEVILANLQSARSRAKASVAETATLRQQLQQSKLTLKDQRIIARQKGTLVDMDAKVGSAISALTPFASFAAYGTLVLHGEVDEMFASRIRLGQKVVVSQVGSKAKIASGEIFYVSPILENKSLFYEKAGETSDRRVRRFKVKLDNHQSLLINERVECTIIL
ncbi:HlyD family secretion protein [Pedobacter sp.]|uniref:HlyD family secretion protein n=1 Tax=Pedobacter sp. TaxID=1411316 RepID=UPI003D7F6837